MTGPGVLFVSNFLSGNGFNRSYAEDLSDRIEARGWRVDRTSRRVAKLARLGDMVGTAWKQRRDYDVAQVDVFSGLAFIWAEAIGFELARLRKPFVLSLHGGNLPSFARAWPRRVRRLLASASEVTSPSNYLRIAMSEYRADIVIRRNAIDTCGIPFRGRNVVQPRLVWVRAFHAIYDPVGAVDVVVRLRERFPGLTMRMVGPDKGDGSFELVRSRIVEHRLQGVVELVGAVQKTDVYEELARADILINTSTIDNTPLSVLEAMAAGLCVVTTSVGGIPYLVGDTGAAIQVRPRDPDAMASAVARVLNDETCAIELSARGRALATQYDWAGVLDDWESAFRKLIGAS